MNDDPHQFAKIAYLKKSTGHPLTAEEAHAVDAFITIPEGRAYVEGTEAMREALCAKRQPVPSLDSKVMVARIESQMKSEAKAMLQPRNYLRFYVSVAVFALLGSSLMIFVPHPTHGLSERIQGCVILTALLLGFAIAVCLRARRIAGDRDLFRREWRAEVVRRSPGRYMTIVVLVALLGFLVGWGLAIGLSGTVLLLAVFVKRSLRRMRMRQDAELWGWWEETLE